MATTSGVATGAFGTSAGAFAATTLLVGDSMSTDFTVQFQLYTFLADFPYLQQTGWQVVL